MLRVISLALCLTALAAVAVDAKTLRWAGRGDMQTTDPHSQNENLTNNINSLVYDTLVQRDKDLKLEPALAVSWQQVNPTTWCSASSARGPTRRNCASTPTRPECPRRSTT